MFQLIMARLLSCNRGRVCYAGDTSRPLGLMQSSCHRLGGGHCRIITDGVPVRG